MSDEAAEPAVPLRYGRFGLRTECPRCGAHLPVNGPVEAVDCADCSERVPVPQSLWVDLGNTFEDQWPDPGEQSGQVLSGSLTWRWTVEVVDGPTCAACKAKVDGSTASGTGQVPCPSCAALLPTFPAPGPLRSRSTAVQVIGGEAELTRAADPPRPVALQCPQCGGSLSITTEHRRVHTCHFCSSSVHIPDAVWRALHPPRLVHPWTVRFEGVSRAEKRAAIAREKEERKRIAAENKRKKQAEKDRLRSDVERNRSKRAQQEREQKEAAARRQRLLSMPLVVSAWVGAFGAAALMGLSSAVYVLGVADALGRFGLDATTAHWAGPSMVAGTAVLSGLAMLLAAVSMAVRARLPMLRTLLMVTMNVAMVAIPLVGPVVGIVLVGVGMLGRGFPVNEDRRAPRMAAFPVYVLLLAGGFFIHVCYAAAGGMTVGELVTFIIENAPED
ncbi:MAG: hypothetical protein R3F61_14510 [Myxococcota bacterium]